MGGLEEVVEDVFVHAELKFEGGSHDVILYGEGVEAGVHDDGRED